VTDAVDGPPSLPVDGAAGDDGALGDDREDDDREAEPMTLDDDPGWLDPDPAFGLPTLRRLLNDTGVDDELVARAEEAGVLGFFAIERFAVPEPARYDLGEIAAATGMPAQQIALMWRSLGLPEPRPGVRIFTEVDAEMLGTIAGLMDLGLIEPDLAAQMSRVIGWSLARVATAMVDSIEVDPAGRAADAPELAVFAGTMLPTMTQVIEHVWRRHLQIAARRRIVRELDTGENRDVKAVGFADLVGFTTLSQQVDEHTLASIVGRFEEIAYDTVTSFEGRVVKMIGDEVMYVLDDPTEAVRVGLALADEYAADEALSDVRVGLACGPVVEREADLYGPVVNLASRIVNIAFPGSVVTTDEVHAVVGDDDRFAWKSLKPRKIKDIGRVPLWAVRPATDVDRAGPRSEVRERRTEARERRLDALDESRLRARRSQRSTPAEADGAPVSDDDDPAPSDRDAAAPDDGAHR
jgi:adenylate cyclase